MAIIRMDWRNQSQKEILERILPDDLLEQEQLQVLADITGDGILRGILALTEDVSVLRIAFIYVEQGFRRQGVATGLLDSLLLTLEMESYPYPVELHYIGGADHQPLHEFLTAYGCFALEQRPQTYLVTAADIEKSEYCKKMRTYECSSVKPFSKLTKQKQNAYLIRYKENGMYFLEDYRSSDSYVEELCLCLPSKDENRDAVFFKKSGEKELELAFLFGENTKNITYLLAACVKEIYANYTDYTVRIHAVYQQSEKLVKKMFPWLEADVVTTARWIGIRRTRLEEVLLGYEY